MGANFLNYRAHEIYTMNGNKISKTFVKWDNEKKICELSDIIPIAEGQIKLENQLSKLANRILICDTDLLETKVYSETYYDGYCDPILENRSVII